MKVNVIRGENQIGGSLIEVVSNQARLLLDAGMELDEQYPPKIPDIDGLFRGTPSFDAILISHYHQDHTGLLNFVLKGIPIYMAKNMAAINETVLRRMNIPIEYTPRIINSNGEALDGSYSFRIKDITITPFLCDHSAFDSYMYLLETDDDSVLYTGDFRSNGRKDFDALCKSLPSHVNKLICEGTTLSRNSSAPNKTESEIEEELIKLMECNKNVFVFSSTTNIDRITSVYNACVRTGRKLGMDAFQAGLLTAIDADVPKPGVSSAVRVCQIGNDNEAAHVELSAFRGHTISRKTLCDNSFTMLVRSNASMKAYIKRMPPEVQSNSVLIYSMWEGYKNQQSTMNFLNFCESAGMEIVSLHTSGHADSAAIKAVLSATKPDVTIPVHTLASDIFKSLTV